MSALAAAASSPSAITCKRSEAISARRRPRYMSITFRRATGSRAPRGPGERRIEVGHIDEIVAAELLFGLDIRAVEHLGFAVGDAHCGCSGYRLQAIGRFVDAGLFERFGVGPVSCHGFLYF